MCVSKTERNALKTWLIDTALFATLAAASSQKSGLRHWLEAHREPVFLSTDSLVEIEAAIGRVPASQQARISGLREWLDRLLSTFSDRIHPVDAAVAVRVQAPSPLPCRVCPSSPS